MNIRPGWLILQCAGSALFALTLAQGAPTGWKALLMVSGSVLLAMCLIVVVLSFTKWGPPL
jgi:hypothetical protein